MAGAKKTTQKGFEQTQRFKRLSGIIRHKNEFDKNIFDLVLKTLYNAADKNGLRFEEDILAPQNLTLPEREYRRLWNVLCNSGWVSPVIGFGNAGKLSLSKAGYLVMEQYGGYLEYLKAMNENPDSQTIIMPIEPMAEENRVKRITPPEHKVKKR